MDETLDTYDPNWKTRYNSVQRKLSELYRSVSASNGDNDVEKTLQNPVFQQRQEQLRKDELKTEQSQHKTVDDCAEYYNQFLREAFVDRYTAYARKNGAFLTSDDLADEQFNRMLGIGAFAEEEIEFSRIPNEIQALCTVKNTEHMNSAMDVYEQFEKQYATADDDFKDAVKLFSALHNVSPLHQDQNDKPSL